MQLQARKGRMMKYPNLDFAACERRYADWEIARGVGLTPWAYSRRKTGQIEFTPDEMDRISEFLRCDAAWLFSRPQLPCIRSAGSDLIAPLLKPAHTRV
jgi:hypothetical protein